MAATGKTPILLYGSTTATNVPVAGNLTNNSDGCEIAINVADKNLFFKDSTNTVNTVPIRQSSASSSGWLSSTDWSTFNGKAPSFTYTTGYIPFGQGTTTPTQDAALFWDNTNKRLGVGTASPSSKFEVNGGSANTISRVVSTTGYALLTSVNSAGSTYFGLDTSAGALTGTAYATAIYSSANTPIIFTNNNTEKARIDPTSGDLTVKTGNLVIGTSGKGIDFSATAGTGTSELLADYEEGTFTPTIFGSTAAGTATYAYQLGFYTKIGRMVLVTIRLEWTGHTGTGIMQFGGLPYTSVNNAIYTPAAFFNANITLAALNVLQPFVNPNATNGTFQQYPVGGGANSVVAMDAAGTVWLSIQYQAA